MLPTYKWPPRQGRLPVFNYEKEKLLSEHFKKNVEMAENSKITNRINQQDKAAGRK